jgi:endonuclease/exonuclease/phosphatase (EEP) superfamily protein YafD
LVDAPGCARGLAWARLQTEEGPVTVASIHMRWPWPHNQARHVEDLREVLAALPEPLLIAGDFNNAPWAHSVDTIAAITGTRITEGLRLTFDRPVFWPGLPLDHVLTSEDLLAETEAHLPLGSDHTALITRVNIR